MAEHGQWIEFEALEYRADGSVRAVRDHIQGESLLEVRVNGAPLMRVACIADHLAELVVGRLFTDGAIGGMDDVASIDVSDDPLRVDVRLAEGVPEPRVGNVLEVPTHGGAAATAAGVDANADAATSSVSAADSTSTASTSASTSTADLDSAADSTSTASAASNSAASASASASAASSFSSALPRLEPVVPIPWSVRRIFELARIFEADSPAHARTMATHSCYLATTDELLCCREDLGRHNAFDKAIGSALLDGVDLSRCIVFTSGRVPIDMVAKAIRARIPILVSKAVPTDKTIQLARDHDLTLICSAHPDAIRVFNDPSTR